MIMRIENLESLSEMIKNARKSQGLTQAELAGACGVGVRYIVDLENAKPTCQIVKTNCGKTLARFETEND